MGQLSDVPTESLSEVNAKLDAADKKALEVCK